MSSDTLAIEDSFDKIYGLDPLLYNGIIYKSFYPSNVFGDQYLSNSNYIKGEATIRGVIYTKLDLNFDIYKQEVLLKYLNLNHVFNTIMLSKTWLESFTIGNRRFVLLSTTETPKRIYQVLGKDSLRLLYYWKKDLRIENASGSKNYIFSSKKEQYIFINNSLHKYYNNRSFYQYFAKVQQIQIRKYLKINKIKVNNAQDQIMEEFINYCSKLSLK